MLGILPVSAARRVLRLRALASANVLAPLAAAVAAATGVTAIVHALPSRPARQPVAGAHKVGGFYIAVPMYRMAAWDPSRIGSFSFRLSPVTPHTGVRAGIVPRELADSCTIGVIRAGSATVTCSYQRAHAPTVRAASALTVVASG